jgi:hypothetical protein
MSRRFLVRLAMAALLVRLLVLGLAYAAPRALALRDYAPSRTTCESLGEYLARRPECAVLAEDEIAYDALGRNIAAGRGFATDQDWVLAVAGAPTAYGGFTYPAFVATVYAATHDNALALFLLQSLIGALAVAGMAAAAFRLGGERAALVTGILAAVHPGLAMDSAWVMSEALAVPLLLGAYLLWVRYLARPSYGVAALFGATAAAACLTRSPAAFALGVMVLVSFFVVGAARETTAQGTPEAGFPAKPGVPKGSPVSAQARQSIPERGRARLTAARHLAIALVAFAACVAPWATRNARVFHSFVPFDTKAGAGLWLNNHPSPAPYREAWSGRLDPHPAPGPVPGLNEAQADAHFRDLAIAYATHHPATFAGVTAMRLGLAVVPVPRYWGRWPAARLAATAAYIAVTWLALYGLWLVRRTPAGRALGGFVVAWLVMMSLTAAGLRHRLAAEWAFTVAAGVALAMIAPRGARPQPPPPRTGPR